MFAPSCPLHDAFKAGSAFYGAVYGCIFSKGDRYNAELLRLAFSEIYSLTPTCPKFYSSLQFAVKLY